MNAQETERSGFQRVAVAVDDWPTHVAAINLALAIVAPGGELIFVTAVNRAALTENCKTIDDVGIVLDALDAEECRLLAAAVARAAARGVRSTARSLDLEGTHGLEEFVRTAAFDAAVVGTHANDKTAARCLGPTAKVFLRSSPVPVIITSEENASTDENGFRVILVVLDGSIPCDPVVANAIALAQRSGARVVFAHLDDDVSPHVLAQSVLSRARESAARAGVAADSMALFGFTSAAVTAAAHVTGSDAIVLGDHDRSSYHAPQPAAVVNMIIRTARVPVAVVPVPSAASIRRARVA